MSLAVRSTESLSWRRPRLTDPIQSSGVSRREGERVSRQETRSWSALPHRSCFNIRSSEALSPGCSK